MQMPHQARQTPAPLKPATLGEGSGAEERGTWQVRPGSRSGHGREGRKPPSIWPRQGDFCPSLRNPEVRGLLRQPGGFGGRIHAPARVFTEAATRRFRFRKGVPGANLLGFTPPQSPKTDHFRIKLKKTFPSGSPKTSLQTKSRPWLGSPVRKQGAIYRANAVVPQRPAAAAPGT